jgi:hypothetical protein
MEEINMQIRDAYAQFFELFSKEDFFDFGFKNIITVDKEVVGHEWQRLIDRINQSSDDLYVRNFGRNGNENDNLAKLYKEVFNININFDPTNNAKPKQLLQNLTGHVINKTIFNYQISHVFGNTKNVYCFTAPWNIIFIPKIIDPFTGHEAKGNYVDEFQKIFKRNVYEKFREEILEYNEIIRKMFPEIKIWIDSNVLEKKREGYLKDFKEIGI